MNKKNKNIPKVYDLEFKKSSARLAVESKRSVAETARSLGISVNTLYGWVKTYEPTISLKSQGNSDINLHEELKRLKKENDRLRQERDILKKAAAYFANEIR